MYTKNVQNAIQEDLSARRTETQLGNDNFYIRDQSDFNTHGREIEMAACIVTPAAVLISIEAKPCHKQ